MLSGILYFENRFVEKEQILLRGKVRKAAMPNQHDILRAQTKCCRYDPLICY